MQHYHLLIPFALLGQYAVTILFTAMSPLMHKADQCAENADTKGIDRINYLAMGALALLFALIVLAGMAFGSAVGEQLTTLLPDWVWTGLSAAGKMMPALGFCNSTSRNVKQRVLNVRLLRIHPSSLLTITTISSCNFRCYCCCL